MVRFHCLTPHLDLLQGLLLTYFVGNNLATNNRNLEAQSYIRPEKLL
jgi:hypothetical protein